MYAKYLQNSKEFISFGLLHCPCSIMLTIISPSVFRWQMHDVSLLVLHLHYHAIVLHSMGWWLWRTAMRVGRSAWPCANYSTTENVSVSIYVPWFPYPASICSCLPDNRSHGSEWILLRRTCTGMHQEVNDDDGTRRHGWGNYVSCRASLYVGLEIKMPWDGQVWC